MRIYWNSFMQLSVPRFGKLHGALCVITIPYFDTHALGYTVGRMSNPKDRANISGVGSRARTANH
jgi:hypothetical protein